MPTPANIPPTVAPWPGPETVRDLARVSGQPALRSVVTVASQGIGLATFSVQVVNHTGRACGGVYEVLVMTSEDGDVPGGSHSLGLDSGVLLETLTADVAVSALTEPDGTLSVTLSGAAPGERRLMVVVRGVADVSESAFV